MQCENLNSLRLRSRSNGDLVVAKREEVGKAYVAGPTLGNTRWGRGYCGECEHIGEHLVAHFVHDNQIFVLIDSSVAPIGKVFMSYKVLLGRCRFVAKFPDGQGYCFEYSPISGFLSLAKLFLSYWKPGVDEIDYGRFLVNLSESDRRKKTVIEAFDEFD